MDIEKYKYPIGKFHPDANFNNEIKASCIKAVESFSVNMRSAIEKLNEMELKSPYRPSGWTIHQLVHHCSDSHMNAYCRFKLALTEDTPTIKTYNQEGWIQSAEVIDIDVKVPLNLLDALHTKWTALLKNMSDDDFNKTLYHPEMGKRINLGYMLQLYGWHSNHHLAHVTEFIKRKVES